MATPIPIWDQNPSFHLSENGGKKSPVKNAGSGGVNDRVKAGIAESATSVGPSGCWCLGAHFV